jgi:hypothetical protein
MKELIKNKEYQTGYLHVLSLDWSPPPPPSVIKKRHGNEADFLGFSQKLGPHRSLTLPFESFRFWLRIRGDIRNRKTTPRLGKSVSRRLSDSVSWGVADSPTRWVGESLTLRLGESESRRLTDLPSRGVGFWMFKRKTWQVGESATPRLG